MRDGKFYDYILDHECNQYKASCQCGHVDSSQAMWENIQK